MKKWDDFKEKRSQQIDLYIAAKKRQRSLEQFIQLFWVCKSIKTGWNNYTLQKQAIQRQIKCN